MPPPEVPSPPSLHQHRGTLLSQNEIFTLGGVEREISGKSFPSLQTWYYMCCSGWEVFGICFLGMTQVPLFYPKCLPGPTPAEKPKQDTDEVVSIFADALLDAQGEVHLSVESPSF